MINDFWDYLQKLADISTVVINRPKDSTHQRYPNGMYPVNYGYLKGTTSIDSGGVDIWVGSLRGKKVVGVLCTVDLVKRDTELKILFDCTDEEIRSVNDFVNTDQM